MSQTRVASRKRRGRVLKLHPVPSSRLITVVVLLCSALGGLGMRLAWLQLVAGEQLESRARQAQTERRNPLGRRRTIVDRQGRLLAIDEERVTVWAHPRYFRWPGDDPEQRRSPREVAEKLAPILGVSASSLSQRMGQHRSGVRLAS
ncbi:MAG: penicillin-binding protein 2, partial [Synechococcus sp.]|nr:penicillin-binding protein 2 [Synechococcus sp.]